MAAMYSPARLSQYVLFEAAKRGDLVIFKQYFSQPRMLQAALAVEARISMVTLVAFAGKEMHRTDHGIVPLDAWMFLHDNYNYIFRVAITHRQYHVLEWLFTSPLARVLHRTLQFFLLDIAIIAVLYKDYYVFEMLLESLACQAYPHEAQPVFMSALLRAGMDWHNSTILQMVAAHGADFNRVINNFGDPLGYAFNLISSGHTVGDLRDQGTVTVGDSATFHLAAKYGYPKAVPMLLELGVDPRARDYELNTPLHHAASKGHYEVVAALLEDVAIDMDAKNGQRETPLILAVQKKYVFQPRREPR